MWWPSRSFENYLVHYALKVENDKSLVIFLEMKFFSLLHNIRQNDSFQIFIHRLFIWPMIGRVGKTPDRRKLDSCRQTFCSSLRSQPCCERVTMACTGGRWATFCGCALWSILVRIQWSILRVLIIRFHCNYRSFLHPFYKHSSLIHCLFSVRFALVFTFMTITEGSEELGKSIEYRADVGVSGRYAETSWGEPSNSKFVSKFLSWKLNLINHNVGGYGWGFWVLEV